MEATDERARAVLSFDLIMFWLNHMGGVCNFLFLIF